MHWGSMRSSFHERSSLYCAAAARARDSTRPQRWRAATGTWRRVRVHQLGFPQKLAVEGQQVVGQRLPHQRGQQGGTWGAPHAGKRHSSHKPCNVARPGPEAKRRAPRPAECLPGDCRCDAAWWSQLPSQQPWQDQRKGSSGSDRVSRNLADAAPSLWPARPKLSPPTPVIAPISPLFGKQSARRPAREARLRAATGLPKRCKKLPGPAWPTVCPAPQ